MAKVNGSCDKRFEAVRDALAESLDNRDVGASAAVFVDGALVADLWGGYADAERTMPWQRDTVVNVYSVSKTMLALCALILADRGELDLDAPVARYWPQFAAAGKERVLVRHVLSHTAGLPNWTEPTTAEDLYDWATATARLAAQAPLWEPGTEAGYHSITQGFLLGELVWRITGRSIGTFFADEVAGPLGADFHIGLSAEHDHRVALTLPPPSRTDDFAASAPGADAPAPPAGRNPIRVRDGNSVAWRRAEIPAASGYGTAHAVALVQSVMACGGTVHGVRLLSPEGCARAWQEQFRGPDRELGMSMRWGLGYGMFGDTYGWGGWGGSMVMIEPSSRMAAAFVTNQMPEPGTGAEFRALEIVMSAYDGLKGLQADRGAQG